MAVGTELLLGQIANTNATYISQQLAARGIDVMYQTVVGDNEQRIAELMEFSLERVDVLIITGGLGPTHDDLTREALARVTGRPLERVPELEQQLRSRFERMGRQMAKTNLRQADRPEGARSIPNPRGTAPGIALVHNHKYIYAMPGVPSEMERMLEEFVLPELTAAAGDAVVLSRVLAVAGVPESDLAERLADVIKWLDEEPTATIASLPSAGEVRLRITAKDVTVEKARAKIEPVEARIRGVLGSAVYGADEDSLEASVAKILDEKALKLAVAESITGGMLASRLVDVPGASKFLVAGYITYSLEAKADLGVPRDVLDRHGTVSQETAIAMADAARRKAGADVAVATCGEAGPVPSEEQVGTVFIALSWEGGSVARGFRAPGEREAIRRWASNGALNLLRLWLMGEMG